MSPLIASQCERSFTVDRGILEFATFKKYCEGIRAIGIYLTNLTTNTRPIHNPFN